MKRILLAILVLLALGGILAARELTIRWDLPLTIPEQGYVLTVAPGDSLRAIADKLHTAGILAYPRLVMLYGRWTGADQQLKQGEYLLPKNSTPTSLLELLQSGNVMTYLVTLPEGITLSKALDILADQEALEHTLKSPVDPRINDLVKPYAHPEGLFLPDTYQFSRGASDWSILKRAHEAMLATLQREWESRAEGLPYESPYEALIMASIIERETGLPEEREMIAGVFTRRLESNMLLQTDPTVIYGLADEFDGNLRRSHLSQDTNRYNTYRHSGLPPTPIALPGLAAIHAALHPADGESLFFVARGDGGHVFSTTLAEHNAAVRQYQLKRAKNYRSTPERRK